MSAETAAVARAMPAGAPGSVRTLATVAQRVIDVDHVSACGPCGPR